MFLAGAGVWLYVIWRTSTGLNQRGKYTIGYVTGRSVWASSGWSAQYRFTVDGITYTGSKSEWTNMIDTVGARYLLRYDSLAPGWHQVYYEFPIPDSIQQAPPNGWRWRPWPNPEHPELSRPEPVRTPTEAELWPSTQAKPVDSASAGSGW